MSESYNEQSKITFIDVLLLFISVLVAIPILPFCMIYIFIMLKTNKKENYVIATATTLIAILFTKISLFIEQATRITDTIIKSIINGGFAITAYQEYSFSSWVLLIAISFIIASYAVKRIRFNYKLEEVGIHTLNR